MASMIHATARPLSYSAEAPNVYPPLVSNTMSAHQYEYGVHLHASARWHNSHTEDAAPLFHRLCTTLTKVPRMVGGQGIRQAPPLDRKPPAYGMVEYFDLRLPVDLEQTLKNHQWPVIVGFPNAP